MELFSIRIQRTFQLVSTRRRGNTVKRGYLTDGNKKGDQVRNRT